MGFLPPASWPTGSGQEPTEEGDPMPPIGDLESWVLTEKHAGLDDHCFEFVSGYNSKYCF